MLLNCPRDRAKGQWQRQRHVLTPYVTVGAAATAAAKHPQDLWIQFGLDSGHVRCHQLITCLLRPFDKNISKLFINLVKASVGTNTRIPEE